MTWNQPLASIHETCPCGAIFDFEAIGSDLVRKAAEEWRAAHAACRAVAAAMIGTEASKR